MFAEVRVVVVPGGVLDDEVGGVRRVEELGDLVVGVGIRVGVPRREHSLALERQAHEPVVGRGRDRVGVDHGVDLVAVPVDGPAVVVGSRVDESDELDRTER